ncbi:amino acid ABC transporter substrate-binding protein, PAAT family (TC 3.A.1.3.-) [Collimonas sp. OK242]|jgi:glutamate/aspartate transport system substrate-binding protein|uniref:amino acid ABC transporter substrate-binding protein n=1 Tax=Collimonas sp. OK242 TaxID=1798195 RepID=UPI00089927D4|nr:amino acid ABC transporter substrate-binding protein [Collimonas sp. OK242]SDX07252.1 amino acid ABC transporter substrate-binding protein, PAAT family (TC 3.A.1.3.-) [Collimonas sp. OK242]
MHTGVFFRPGYSILASLLLGSSLFSPPAIAGATLAKIRDTQTITLAYRETTAPFSYLDADKKPIGFTLDLCSKIVDGVRRELKLPQLKVNYLAVTPSTRIAAVTSGKADLECGTTTNNAERRKQVAFTVPHFFAGVRMAVRADSGIRNWADLRGKRVVTTKGTTTVKLLNDRNKVRALALNLVDGADHAESFSMLEKGQADAFVMDDVILFGLRANMRNPADFVIVGDAMSVEPYAIMLSKDDAEFKTLVDREMANMENDGDFRKIYNRWFMSPVPPKGKSMDMPMGYLLRDSIIFPTDKVGD